MRKNELSWLLAATLVAAIHHPTAAAQSFLHQIDATVQGGMLGKAVSPAGDVNSDGHDDFAISSPDWTGTNLSKIRIHSGLDATVLREYVANDLNHVLGDSLASAGDVNLDGFVDLVAGDPMANQLLIFSGSDGTVLGTFSGGALLGRLGESVAGAGDVDGDGFDDVIGGDSVDDRSGSWAGSVEVFSGQSGLLLYTLLGQSAFDRLGSSVSGAGDINSDGLDDFAAGAKNASYSAPDAGTFEVFSGANGSSLRTVQGLTQNGHLGTSMANAGDIDGDGFSELIVGASGGGMNQRGLARVYSGQTGAVLHSLETSGPDSALGASVGSAGDYDGDGVPDLVVGAPNHRIDDGPSYARVFSGRTGSTLALMNAGSEYNVFGYSVCGVGDVNADGRSEVLVGAPFGPDFWELTGKAWVFSASCGPLPTHGDGCAGRGGHIPKLDLSGCAARNGTVSLELEGGFGGATTFLVVGTGTGLIPFRGCDLLVDPIAAILTTRLAGFGSGAGTLSASVTLPATAPLGMLALQMFVVDPDGLWGLSASIGVSAVIQ